MNFCRVLPIAGAALMMAACAPGDATTAVPAGPPALAPDFEASIARLDSRDPDAPQALNARLQYADFLASSAAGDCRQRLDTAQAQLDTLATRPAFQMLLPLGPAQLAGSEYKIHLARADCGADATRHGDELRQALTAARDAVTLYDAALDYQSAAVMQYNTAVTLHALGDDDGARTALETALAMDREHGFKDDAADNIRLLLAWKKQDAGPDAVADRMKDFPAATTAFTFNWSPSQADVTIQADDANVAAGQVIKSHGRVTLKRQVAANWAGWLVTWQAGQPDTTLGNWPARYDMLRDFALYLLDSALLQNPDFIVNPHGDFKAMQSKDLGKALSQQVMARLGDLAAQKPGEDAGPPGSAAKLARSLTTVFSPQVIQADAAEQHDMQTAAWVGAKLQLGAWYQMRAPMILHLGMAQFLVQHDIAFSYTRAVACTPADTVRACAEIVVHATPDAEDLKHALDEAGSELKFARDQAWRYWSTTDLRLVVRPETLAPYVSDTRLNWYATIDGAGQAEPLIESEHIVATFSYH